MQQLGRQFNIAQYVGERVAKVSDKLTAELQQLDSGITGVHYLHGHPREIIETLMQRDKSPSRQFDKYPLVCLFQDFPETWSSDGIVEAVLNIVICSSTLADFKAPERYARNFVPILYPIFDELIKAIRRGPNTVGYDPVFKKYDRLYWGKAGLYGNQGNIFNDRLDAVELMNFKLKLNTLIC